MLWLNFEQFDQIDIMLLLNILYFMQHFSLFSLSVIQKGKCRNGNKTCIVYTALFSLLMKKSHSFNV